MPGLPIVFYILAAVAVITALGTILSRNAVYAALFLVLNFATVAVLYLILGAPFIALSQITVYAGSIMVLFLFVIMLLGAERMTESESLHWQPLLAIPLALILAVEFAYSLIRWMSSSPTIANPGPAFGTPKAIGQLLFTQYALPFEITAVILLSAVVGAIVLAKPDRPSPRPVPGTYARQVIDPAAESKNGGLAAVGQPTAEKEAPAGEQEQPETQKVEG